MNIPLIPEITLKYIVERLSRDYGLKKTTDIGEIFGTYKNLQRILDPNIKKNLSDIDCRMLLNKIKEISGDFRSTVVEWFPSLGIYQTSEEIESIITGNLMGTASGNIAPTPPHFGSKEFLQSCLLYRSSIKHIKMSSQTGWSWFNDDQKTSLLTKLATEKIDISVIGNPESAIKSNVVDAIPNSSGALRYTGINQTLAKWHAYENTYPSLHFRISDYPISRQIFIVEFQDGSSQAFIRDYTYGSFMSHNSPYRKIMNTDLNYKYYKIEFEVLWNKAKSYEEWHNSLPEPEEFMDPCKYILLYPPHEKGTDLSKSNGENWVYSELLIEAGNSAILKVNVSNRYDAKTSCEYLYRGNIKLTRNSIFIALYDNEQQESVNISLPRPLHNKNRFLGILSALSPAGQPVAFKCACVEQSALQKLNYSVLGTLLSNNHYEWNDSLLILDNKDINIFYSNRIFRKL